jgi:hypothetical protein
LKNRLQVHGLPPVIVGRQTNNLNLNIKNTHFNYQPPSIVGRLTNNLYLSMMRKKSKLI